MDKLLIHTLLLGAILIGTCVTGTNIVAAGNKHSEQAPGQDDLDQDRINLNLNRGHAAVHGIGGGSVSDSVSRGVQVGIRRPGMADTTLYQNSDSYGSSQTYGQRPPTAWTGADNQISNGVNRGGATAGFSGGEGIAQTETMSQTVEIPLDNFGTVLFSNLQEKPHAGHGSPSVPHEVKTPVANEPKPILQEPKKFVNYHPKKVLEI